MARLLNGINRFAGADFLQRFKHVQVIEELARRNLIGPVATLEHIGNVLPDKIVYDAQTAFADLAVLC